MKKRNHSYFCLERSVISERRIEKGKEGLTDRTTQACSLDLSEWRRYLFLRITTICERQERNKNTAVS